MIDEYGYVKKIKLPEEPHGKWIVREDDSSFVSQIPRRWVECPECGRSFEYSRHKDRFCSWCGSDMRESEDT